MTANTHVKTHTHINTHSLNIYSHTHTCTHKHPHIYMHTHTSTGRNTCTQISTSESKFSMEMEQTRVPHYLSLQQIFQRKQTSSHQLGRMLPKGGCQWHCFARWCRGWSLEVGPSTLAIPSWLLHLTLASLWSLVFSLMKWRWLSVRNKTIDLCFGRKEMYKGSGLGECSEDHLVHAPALTSISRGRHGAR